MATQQEPRRHRSQSILSNRTNSTWRADVFGKREPRGAMVFSGPDSLRMHRHRTLDPMYIGERLHQSPEFMTSAMCLWRAAPGTPHPRPKSSFSDAYGWGTWGETAELCSWRNLGRSHPIKLGTFRQQMEQQFTHTNQSAWYGGRDAGKSDSSLRHSNGEASPGVSESDLVTSSEIRANSSKRLLSGRQQNIAPGSTNQQPESEETVTA